MKSVQLIPSVSSVSKRDISKCIFCQKDKHDENINSTPDGRKKAKTFIEAVGNNFLEGLTTQEVDDKIQYHSKSCFSTFRKRASRTSQNTTPGVVPETSSSEDHHTRTRSMDSSNAASDSRGTNAQYNEKCIVCDHIKHKDIRMKYRISEVARAKLFIQAYTFNKDDVYRRCILYRTSGDVFAADLYAHKDCMKLYIVQFSRTIYDTLESLKEIEEGEAKEQKTQEAFDLVFGQLELATQGYEVTEVRKLVNKQLTGTDLEVNNRQVKGELIRRYGTTICFSYPTNKSISQLFFSSSFKVTDVAETVRK